jgi:hypothetical protein
MEVSGGQRLAVAPPQALPQAESIGRAVRQDFDAIVGPDIEASIEAKQAAVQIWRKRPADDVVRVPGHEVAGTAEEHRLETLRRLEFSRRRLGP